MTICPLCGLKLEPGLDWKRLWHDTDGPQVCDDCADQCDSCEVCSVIFPAGLGHIDYITDHETMTQCGSLDCASERRERFRQWAEQHPERYRAAFHED